MSFTTAQFIPLIEHMLLTTKILQDFDRRVDAKPVGCGNHHECGHVHRSKEAEAVLADMDSLVEPTLKKAASVFEGVVARGLADKQKLDAESAVYIRAEILKEAFVQEMVKKHQSFLAQKESSNAKVLDFFADPAMVDRNRPELLNQITVVSDLMAKGFAIQNFHIEKFNLAAAVDELRALDLICRYKSTGLTEYAFFFAKLDDFDRAKEMNIRRLFEALQAIPFELNSKIKNACLQIQSEIQFAVIEPKSRISKHFDGAPKQENENGRSITVLYSFSPCTLLIDEKPMELSKGSLVILKSRQVAYEIRNSATSKVFLAFEFITGPRGVLC